MLVRVIVDDVGEGGGREGSSVTVKLFCYKKLNMNHTGSLTLAWPQCCAENNDKCRERGRKKRVREGERKHIKKNKNKKHLTSFCMHFE